MKIRDNQELERKVQHLEETERVHKAAIQHLETECGGLKDQVRRLQADVQNSSYGVSAAEDLEKTELVRCRLEGVLQSINCTLSNNFNENSLK